jgi:hypothetical protein
MMKNQLIDERIRSKSFEFGVRGSELENAIGKSNGE